MIEDVTGVDYDGSAVNIPTATGAAAPALATGGTITATDVDADGKLSVGDKIIVPFDKTINTTPDIAEANFDVERVGSADTNIQAGTTFTAAAEGSNVVLTFTAVDTTDAVDVSSAWSVALTGASSNVKSSWGVETAGVTETNITADTLTKPSITEASYNPNTNKLTVKFSEAVNIDAFGGTDPTTMFSINDGYSLGALKSAVAGTGFYLDAADTTNKTVVFILNGTEVIDAGLVYLNAKAGGATSAGVEDFDGNKVARKDTTGVLINVDATAGDTTAPTISTITGTSIDNAGDTIAITFSEAMDTATLTTDLLSRLTIKLDDDNTNVADGDETTLTLATATGAWSNGNKTFTVTLDEATDGAFIADASYINVAPVATVRDTAGNAIGTTGVYSASTVTKEAIAPQATSVTIASDNTDTTLAKTSDTVTISFVTNEVVGTPTVTIDGNAADAVANASGDGVTWTATRAMQAGDTEAAVSFTIDFDDLAGNSATQVTAVTDSSAVTYDETAPVASSAVSDAATEVVLTMDEALDGTAADSAAFTVNINAGTGTVDSVAVSGTSVTITLDGTGTTIANGDTVTVDYTASGTTDLADVAGNKVANFSGEAVTNNN